MSDIKEFVQTYLLPYGAKPPTRIIALHQYYARIAADTAGMKSVESEDYKVVNDPINDCAIIWCTVRGYYEETQP